MAIFFISTDQCAGTTIQRDPFPRNFSCWRWDRHVAIAACFYFLVFKPGDLYYLWYGMFNYYIFILKNKIIVRRISVDCRWFISRRCTMPSFRRRTKVRSANIIVRPAPVSSYLNSWTMHSTRWMRLEGRCLICPLSNIPLARLSSSTICLSTEVWSTAYILNWIEVEADETSYVMLSCCSVVMGEICIHFDYLVESNK